MNTPRLAKWLSRLPHGQISQIKLIYLSVQGEESVFTWDLTSGEARTESDLTREILETAQDDANSREFRSRYAIQAWAPTEERPRMQFVIVCKPSNNHDPDGVSDPSLAGVVSQALRHNEALMRMIVGSMDNILSAQQAIITLQAEQMKTLRRREQAREEAEPNIEQTAKAEAILKVADSLVEHVVPIVAQKITGIGFPGAPGGDKVPS